MLAGVFLENGSVFDFVSYIIDLHGNRRYRSSGAENLQRDL